MERSDSPYPSIRFVGWLSLESWRLTATVIPHVILIRLKAVLQLIRPGRVIMVTSLTWVSAVIAGVAGPETWLVTLGGMFLAMAGFAFDIYSDREADREGPRPWPVNPLSTGLISAVAARRWILAFVVAGTVLAAAAHPLALLPAAVLLATYWGLAAGWLEGPVGRALTLGLLQALYVLLAASATGRIAPLMVVVSLVFLAAMFGARAAADIRDLPSDMKTDTRTLAKVYGIGPTSWILPVAVTIAASIAFGLYRSGAFDADYLLWTSISFVPALIMAWVFPFWPTPNHAFIIVYPYWGVGILYLIALLSGSA